MKKVILTIITVLLCMVAKSQTLYELKYYDIVDDETYKGLFVFTDEENCVLRCVSKPDKSGRYNWWEYNYTCVYEKEKGVHYLSFIHEEPEDKNAPIVPEFCMEYTTRGGFQSQTYAVFHDPNAEDDTDDQWEEVEYFREIDIQEKDENYFMQFYDADEEMFQLIMEARDLLISQEDKYNDDKYEDDNTDEDGNTADDGSTTMHLILVGATMDETIGESVVTDVNLVKDNFKEIAKKIGIRYKETVIMGNNFKKANIENTVNRLNVGKNDVVIFVYSGHGFRFDDDTDPYPRMYLAYDGEVTATTELSTTELYEKITQKNARLTIFLTDCCNSKYGATRAEVESIAFGTRGTSNNTDVDKLYHLFVEESGTVRATAAKAGQYALCDASGGFMLTSIINNIKSLTSALSKDTPSWEAIIENASKVVAKKTSNQIDERGNETAPQYVVRSISMDGKAKITNETESLSSVNTRSNTNTDSASDDFMIDLTCVLLSVAVILILVIVIIKMLKKKKQK